MKYGRQIASKGASELIIQFHGYICRHIEYYFNCKDIIYFCIETLPP
jgi:hypothetical protein